MSDPTGSAIRALAAENSELRRRTGIALAIVNLYFRPWGAAKTALWESMTNNRPLDAEVALEEIGKALSNVSSAALNEDINS